MNPLSSPTRRRLRLVVVGAFALLGVGVLLAAPAAAHATVVASNPADGSRLTSAPRSVTITFDESVGINGIGYLHVTDASGKRVDAAAAYHPDGDGAKVADNLRSGLGNGAYTASFRVISADSHPVAGTIAFVVGNGALVHGSLGTGNASDPTTSAAYDVVRWISFAGLALLGGFWLLLTIWPAGRDDRRATRLVWTGWGAAFGGAVLETLVEGPFTAGSSLAHTFDPSLVDATLHTSYGVLHCVRLLLLGVLAGVLGRVLGRLPERDREPAAPLTLLLALGIATTFAAAGHAATTSPTWLAVPTDALHVLAMASWLGGLVLLLVAVLPRRDPDELARALPGFSRAAFASVVVLALTGAFQAWRGVGTVSAVFTTEYGWLVNAKILLFVALLAVGNLSRLAVRRRVVAYAMTDSALDDDPGLAPHVDVDAAAEHPSAEHTGDAYDGPTLERLRRSVYVEVLIGVVVLAVTAVLVAQPRGKEALAVDYRQPVSASAPLGGGREATVGVDPGTHGSVDVTVTLGGGATASSITATATQESRKIGPLPITLARHGDGYEGTVTLPVAGAWRFDLVVTAGQYDATTTDTTITLH